MSDLTSYLSVAPTVIAVLNGFLALSVSHVFKDNVRIKWVMLSFVGVLSIVAVTATLVNQHEIVARQNEKATHAQYVINHLAGSIAQGDQLLSKIADPTQPTYSADESLKWAQATESFLSLHLGDAYVTRFRDNVGILHGEPLGVSELRQDYWNWIYERVFRLEEFSSEFSTQSASSN